jgi:hypothetical protein
MSTEHPVERYGYKDNRVPFSNACGTELTFFPSEGAVSAVFCSLGMPYLGSRHHCKSHYEANIISVSSISILLETKGERTSIFCFSRSEHQCCGRE